MVVVLDSCISGTVSCVLFSALSSSSAVSGSIVASDSVGGTKGNSESSLVNSVVSLLA